MSKSIFYYKNNIYL